MAGQSVENSAGHMNNVLTLAHHSFFFFGQKCAKKAPKATAGNFNSALCLFDALDSVCCLL